MSNYRPGNDETRVTSPTGGQKGQKSARFGGGDPLAMMELARIYGFGEEKYDRYNYLKGYKWSLSVDALFRHLFAFLNGEDRDPESGLLHTAHAAWHALTLTSFSLRGVGEDDRAPVATEGDEHCDIESTVGERWDTTTIDPYLEALWQAVRPQTITAAPNANMKIAFYGMPISDWQSYGTAAAVVEPTCCEFACYEDPGCLCDMCEVMRLCTMGTD